MTGAELPLMVRQAVCAVGAYAPYSHGLPLAGTPRTGARVSAIFTVLDIELTWLALPIFSGFAKQVEGAHHL